MYVIRDDELVSPVFIYLFLFWNNIMAGRKTGSKLYNTYIRIMLGETI